VGSSCSDGKNNQKQKSQGSASFELVPRLHLSIAVAMKKHQNISFDIIGMPDLYKPVYTRFM
jgi:hypothetical protein